MKETVQVTRKDREAAAGLWEELNRQDGIDRNAAAWLDGSRDKRALVQAFARHRLSATSAPAGVEGWKLVPVEPTEEMLDAWSSVAGYSNDAELVRGYAAMIAAAPAPSGQEVASEEWQNDPASLESGSPASGVTVPEGEVERAQEAMDEACALIQEAKGFAGPGDVTDHLDFAESWLNKIDLAALSTPSATPGEVPTITDHDAYRLRKVAEADCGCRIPAPFDEVADHLAALAFDEGAKRATATPGALDPATVEREGEDHPDWRKHEGLGSMVAAGLGVAAGGVDYWRIRAEVVRAIRRALATDPHQHGGKGA